LSQARFAALMDTSPVTINRWATGARPVPRAVAMLLRLDLQTLECIADQLALAQD